MKKKILIRFIRISLSLAFFFTFWMGAIYLSDVLMSEEFFPAKKFLSAVIMAVTFTYFTDCGSSLIGLPFLKEKAKQR